MTDFDIAMSELHPRITHWVNNIHYQELEELGWEPRFISSFLIEDIVPSNFSRVTSVAGVEYSPFACSFIAARTVRDFYPPTSARPLRRF